MRKPHCAYRQGYAGQQIESLGNHANDCRNHGCDAIAKSFAIKKESLHEKHDPYRYQSNADKLDQLVQRTDHL